MRENTLKGMKQINNNLAPILFVFASIFITLISFPFLYNVFDHLSIIFFNILVMIIAALLLSFISLFLFLREMLNAPAVYSNESSLTLKYLFKPEISFQLKNIKCIYYEHDFLESIKSLNSYIQRKYILQVNITGEDSFYWFYDSFSEGENIQTFANEVKKENPFLRVDI